MNKRLIILLTISTIVSLFVIIYKNKVLLESMELWFYDLRYYSLINKGENPSPGDKINICYIAIDRASREYYEEKENIKYPWPRSKYTELLNKFNTPWYIINEDTIKNLKDKIKEAASLESLIRPEPYSEEDLTEILKNKGLGEENIKLLLDSSRQKIEPKVIAFDMMFTKEKEEDMEFAQAMKEAGNVITGYSYTYSPEKKKQLAELPCETLKKSSLGIGYLNIFREADTPITDYAVRAYPRRITLMEKDAETGEVYYHFALKVAGLYRGLNEKDINLFPSQYLLFGNTKIPLDGKNNMLINYLWREKEGAKNNPAFNYNKISFKTAMEEGPDFLNQDINKGIVIIGYDSSEDINERSDMFFNPCARFASLNFKGFESEIPGAAVLCYSIRTILEENYITTAGNALSIIIILLMGWISSLLFLRFNIWQEIIACLLLITAYTIINFLIFFLGNLWLPLLAPSIAIILNLIIITVYELQRTRNIFARFLPKTVVEKVLTDQKALELGGEKKEVSVLFSDIRGYTDLSEKLEPDQVLKLLNEFNVAMGDIIKGNNGIIFDYQGDAIMAVFGSPVEDKEHAYKATKTAFEMQKKMDKLVHKWGEEGEMPHIEIGIGVSTGVVAIGMMGSKDHRQYVAIGDSTNVAARVQGKSKELNSPVLITELTYEQAKEKIDAVLIDTPIHVKGKSEPLKLYSVKGIKG